jgi:hypothetical protein
MKEREKFNNDANTIMDKFRKTAGELSEVKEEREFMRRENYELR